MCDIHSAVFLRSDPAYAFSSTQVIPFPDLTCLQYSSSKNCRAFQKTQQTRVTEPAGHMLLRFSTADLYAVLFSIGLDMIQLWFLSSVNLSVGLQHTYSIHKQRKSQPITSSELCYSYSISLSTAQLFKKTISGPKYLLITLSENL